MSFSRNLSRVTFIFNDFYHWDLLNLIVTGGVSVVNVLLILHVLGETSEFYLLKNLAGMNMFFTSIVCYFSGIIIYCLGNTIFSRLFKIEEAMEINKEFSSDEKKHIKKNLEVDLDTCENNVGTAVIKLRSALENRGLKHRFMSFYGKSGLLENIFSLTFVNILLLVLYEFHHPNLLGGALILLLCFVMGVLYQNSLKFKKCAFDEIINKSKSYKE